MKNRLQIIIVIQKWKHLKITRMQIMMILMDPSSSGEVPDELEDAESPKYEEGSKAIIETDHMAGMKGAEATIDGAYDTTAYTVSYTPTDGGEPVEDHKWVIHEELENPDEA